MSINSPLDPALAPLDSEVSKRRGKREPRWPITARRECTTELPTPRVFIDVKHFQLHPAALASVPYGVVLVRVNVKNFHLCKLKYIEHP